MLQAALGQVFGETAVDPTAVDNVASPSYDMVSIGANWAVMAERSHIDAIIARDR